MIEETDDPSRFNVKIFDLDTKRQQQITIYPVRCKITDTCKVYDLVEAFKKSAPENVKNNLESIEVISQYTYQYLNPLDDYVTLTQLSEYVDCGALRLYDTIFYVRGLT
jgi:hypothetical protein